MKFMKMKLYSLRSLPQRRRRKFDDYVQRANQNLHPHLHRRKTIHGEHRFPVQNRKVNVFTSHKNIQVCRSRDAKYSVFLQQQKRGYEIIELSIISYALAIMFSHFCTLSRFSNRLARENRDY